ncbi:hypothetical protein LJR039_005432 [Pseudorhodoferax sp. LjRoot39]|uniref:hypothetical protein n=1 Tax=Pseudorhodoferax sp. LjRoot39 TaxID=3342328 RepID=UPI003ECC5ECC
MGAWAEKRALERLEWEPLILSGATAQALADQRGVSRQRICQKLDALGLDGLYRRVQAAKRSELSAMRADAEDAARMERWGCNIETKREMKEAGAGAAYSVQRANAHKRGIPWELTRGQWWAIWKESGHWHRRGVLRDQYCMSRFGDQGPYSASNVEIVPNAENTRQARAADSRRRAALRTARNSALPQELDAPERSR